MYCFGCVLVVLCSIWCSSVVFCIVVGCCRFVDVL